MRRKNKNFKKLRDYSLTMGATGLIAGGLPTSAKAPVQAVATQGSKFVGPMTNVIGAEKVFGVLKELKPKSKRRSK